MGTEAKKNLEDCCSRVELLGLKVLKVLVFMGSSQIILQDDCTNLHSLQKSIFFANRSLEFANELAEFPRRRKTFLLANSLVFLEPCSLVSAKGKISVNFDLHVFTKCFSTPWLLFTLLALPEMPSPPKCHQFIIHASGLSLNVISSKGTFSVH